MKLNLKVVILLFLSITIAQSVLAEDRLKIDALIAGNWGNREGEFGIDQTGKTEIGYALDFLVTTENVYILDSINNRIQIFDTAGRFKNTLKLHMKWQDFGLPWDFTLYKNSIYLLVGKAPYYNSTGIKEITKLSYKGNFIKTFGETYVPKNTEEYYNTILSDGNKGYIYCGLGGTKVFAFDDKGYLKDTLLIARNGEIINLAGISPEGNPLINLSQSGGSNRRTVIINPNDKKIEKEIKGRFTLYDGKGKFINVHTIGGSKRKKTVMTTIIDVYDSATDKTDRMELKGDIKVRKNGMDRIYRYGGIFLERSRIDSNGNIYHLIALEDGVVLRKITLK